MSETRRQILCFSKCRGSYLVGAGYPKAKSLPAYTHRRGDLPPGESFISHFGFFVFLFPTVCNVAL